MRQFGKSMKVFHSDNGEEFVNGKMQRYLRDHRALHHWNCSHTPEQLDIVERRHRSIVELGMAQLFNCGVSPKYWIESFSTVHILNRLPSSTLPFHESPFQQVYKQNPLYSSFRIFGCRCFPYSKAYASNKFQPKIAPCLFVGYSIHHKGYKCFNPANGRMYVSRHVLFDENSFPAEEFTELHRPIDSPLLLTSFVDQLPQVVHHMQSASSSKAVEAEDK